VSPLSYQKAGRCNSSQRLLDLGEKGVYPSYTPSMRIADIKTLFSYFKKIAPSAKQPKPDLKTTEPLKAKPKVAKASKKKEEILKKDANYWINQGDLCATYGNDKAAVRYYKKALELKPNNSRALFQQGVSYGELGEYEQALTLIDKALAIDARKGLYHYGRGRVLLLSGDKENAVEDLKQAAVLGNQVAQRYLQKTLHIERQQLIGRWPTSKDSKERL